MQKHCDRLPAHTIGAHEATQAPAPSPWTVATVTLTPAHRLYGSGVVCTPPPTHPPVRSVRRAAEMLGIHHAFTDLISQSGGTNDHPPWSVWCKDRVVTRWGGQTTVEAHGLPLEFPTVSPGFLVVRRCRSILRKGPVLYLPGPVLAHRGGSEPPRGAREAARKLSRFGGPAPPVAPFIGCHRVIALFRQPHRRTCLSMSDQTSELGRPMANRV